jgi:hypothetical protein
MPRQYTGAARAAQRRPARAVPFRPLRPAPPAPPEPVARRPGRAPPWESMRRHELARLKALWIEQGRSTAVLDRAEQSGFALLWKSRRLGAELNFTMADYKQFGEAFGRHPATIRPCDVTEAEIRAHLDEVHRPCCAERARERRADEQDRRSAAADVDRRASAVIAVLTHSWRAINTVMDALAHCAAFRGDHDARLTGHSLRVAILRELDKLAIAGRVGIEEVPGRGCIRTKRVRLLA